VSIDEPNTAVPDCQWPVSMKSVPEQSHGTRTAAFPLPAKIRFSVSETMNQMNALDWKIASESGDNTLLGPSPVGRE
jgi:hypothetical protein